MEINPVVDRITIYPVKSLDGISLQKAQIGNGGSLVHDREYAMINSNGKFVNGKSNARAHLLRSQIDFENDVISLKHDADADWNNFHLQNDKPALDEFLSAFFEMPVMLYKNTLGEFLDIPVQSGVTVLSTASLNAVGIWFNNMDIEEIRKRFRATIELTAVPAFWEDKLFLEEGTAIEFKIGDVALLGISPRARCVVPTRHPETGEVIHGFQKSFAQQRTANLPQWSTLDDYNHAYYLSVDCYIPPSEFGKWIAVGDEVKIIGKKTLPTFTH
jgi:uncharacterized protein YcbX